MTRSPKEHKEDARRRYALPKLMVVAVSLASLAACPDRLAARRPWQAQDRDQSAYALGSFALNVIFLESDGSTDPNQEDWTAGQLTDLHTEIEQAAAFWEGLTASYHPNARLDITVNYVNAGVPMATGYEPITRSGYGDRSLWMNQVMAAMGYNSSNADINTRDFNNDQRDSLDTHWAATLYVVNDAADANNMFSDNRFAFSEFGGPYIVTTYGNNGWGIDRYERVLSHELGHVFFALDEYYGSGARNNQRSGYLNGINGNAERNSAGTRVTPPQPDALMINTVLDPSSYTSVQVGHLDSDNDSIPDILDTVPLVIGDTDGSDADAGIFAFSGYAIVNPIDNKNPKTWAESGADITINTIAGGYYNLDGGGWTSFLPTDGQYGGYFEMLELEISGLDPGPHTIDLRIINSVDNYSDTHSFELLVTPEPSSAIVLLLGLCAVVRRGRKHRNADRLT